MTHLTDQYSCTFHVVCENSHSDYSKCHTFNDQTNFALESAKKNQQEHFIPDEICNNRECCNPSGYPSKPNSIYCSSYCQSRGNNHENMFFYFLIKY